MIGMSRCLRVRLQAARRLPAVDLRQVQIHQDQIGPLGRRHRDPGGAIRRAHELVAAEDVEAQLQHVEIVLVVLDVEQPPHRIFIEPVKQEGAR